MVNAGYSSAMTYTVSTRFLLLYGAAVAVAAAAQTFLTVSLL